MSIHCTMYVNCLVTGQELSDAGISTARIVSTLCETVSLSLLQRRIGRFFSSTRGANHLIGKTWTGILSDFKSTKGLMLKPCITEL